ncbi:MAG: exosortase C-terminal domain/associated protein EpsI [Planctomycetota bacterium]
MSETEKRKGLSVPALAWPLVALCLPLLWLGMNRPTSTGSAREGDLAYQLGEFQAVHEYELDRSQAAMLGTEDAIWRAYEDLEGGTAYLYCVFHREDWKSVHSPETCLLGSDMTLTGRAVARIEVGGRPVEAERLLLRKNQNGQPLVSWYVFLTKEGLMSGNYWDFVWFHVGRAFLRSTRPGALVRIDVEAADDAGLEMADRRAKALLERAIPEVLTILR